MICSELCPVMFGCSCEGQRQTQGIEGSIRDQEGRQHFGIDVWLQLERFLWLEFLQGDMALLAAFDELLGIFQVALLDSNEQSRR